MGPCSIDMLFCFNSSMTESSGVSAIKQRSAEPGVGYWPLVHTRDLFGGD